MWAENIASRRNASSINIDCVILNTSRAVWLIITAAKQENRTAWFSCGCLFHIQRNENTPLNKLTTHAQVHAAPLFITLHPGAVKGLKYWPRSSARRAKGNSCHSRSSPVHSDNGNHMREAESKKTKKPKKGQSTLVVCNCNSMEGPMACSNETFWNQYWGHCHCHNQFSYCQKTSARHCFCAFQNIVSIRTTQTKRHFLLSTAS